MKKKVILTISLIVLATILVGCLAACNPYKQASIGGGDKNAPVESNGGYVVKQGNYIYYINGYEGSDAKNEWGQPSLQTIVRSELNEDGTVNNASTKTVVPKSIYNSSANGGITIFGEWIYYATPNSDKDKTGTASTTDTDFMRTKIDGSITQRVGKINSRSSEYLFTPTRVLYYLSNTIYYIDFSGMKTNKNIKNAEGAKSGVLADNVQSVVWKTGYDTIYYVQNPTSSAESFKNFNRLCSMKVDGSEKKVLAEETTYLADTEKPVENPQKVFKFDLRDLYIESDGSATLYYLKSIHIEDNDKNTGLYCTKASDFLADNFDASKEKKLNTIASTTLVPLGYANGAMAHNGQSLYCLYNGTNAEDPLQVCDSSKTIWKVDQTNGIIYYTESSSAKNLYKIAYNATNMTVGNAEIIFSEGIKTDWLKVDFVGDDIYFFATDDSNYMHTINIVNPNKDDEGNVKSVYVGFEREEDEE